jgi:uncharacterized protein YbjQ (UPF0145 family)
MVTDGLASAGSLVPGQVEWPVHREWAMKVAALLVVLLSSVAGCAATELDPGAERVIVSRTPAAKECVYIGTVIGEQGGALTGPYTSNANLAEGAFNDLKNEAHARGANYVVLEDTHAGTTQSRGSSTQTDVTHVGNAYKCPEG